jgi:hypothetical protein
MKPERDPNQRPEALYALRHWTYLVLVQCDRVLQAAQRDSELVGRSEFDIERDEAKHLLLGERFFLLCTGREMVRALDVLQLGRLPDPMHQELRLFRDAVSHWKDWGDQRLSAKARRAEFDIHEIYPTAWPYGVEIKGGDVLVGGSLSVHDIERVARQLYEWSRNPSRPHGLVVPEDPHRYEVTVKVAKGEFFPTIRALKAAKFQCGGGNTAIVVSLLDPAQVADVERVVTAVDAMTVVGRARDRHDED